MTVNKRLGKETVTMTFSNDNLRLTSTWRDDRWWESAGEAVHVLRDYQKVGECTWMTNQFRFIYTYMLLPVGMHGGGRFDRIEVTHLNYRVETNRLLLWPDDGVTSTLFRAEEPVK